MNPTQDLEAEQFPLIPGCAKDKRGYATLSLSAVAFLQGNSASVLLYQREGWLSHPSHLAFPLPFGTRTGYVISRWSDLLKRKTSRYPVFTLRDLVTG